MKTAIARETNSPISLKHSRQVIKGIRGRKVGKARKMLEGLISQKTSLDGKYYTKTARKILDILKAAEANAKNKNLDIEKLFVKIASADKAEKLVTPKSRMRLRGRESKRANIKVVVEER